MLYLDYIYRIAATFKIIFIYLFCSSVSLKKLNCWTIVNMENLWTCWCAKVIFDNLDLFWQSIIHIITLRQSDANQKRFLTFSIVVLCCSMEGELVCKIILKHYCDWETVYRFFLPYPSLPSFTHRQSLYQAAKIDFQAIKAIFVFQLHTLISSFLIFSHFLLSLHYIIFSKLVYVCHRARGSFLLHCWADMVNKPCPSVCLFSNNESVSQSATQSVNLRVSELSHSY